jgi:flavin-dependent dehydrogenase
MDTQHILEHNKNILDKLKTYQEEINYKIVDKLDYSKKIQKILLDRTVFDKKTFSSDKLVPLCLKRVDSNVILDKDASHILSQLKTVDFRIVRSIIQIIFNNI